MNALGYDFAIFWEAARALLAGHSPYSVPGFFSPLPFLLPVLPLALLPYWAAFSVWTVFNLAALALVARRHALRALLFLPVLFSLWVGQVDLIIIALAFTGTWWGLALAALKPQLAVWLIPFFVLGWWRAGHKTSIVRMLSTAAALYTVPTVLDPSWWTAWLEATPSVLRYSEHASSLFGISALLQPTIPLIVSFGAVSILGGAVFFKVRPLSDRRYWSWAALFNPLANVYSQCILVPQADWIALALSWLLLPLSLHWHTGLPWAVVPVYLLWRTRRVPNDSPGPTLPTQA
jgi:hypothetical protein